MERQSTVKRLFHEEGIQFAIPAYQRAYSWEYDKDRKQIQQFIMDIKEQNFNKKYFLGHFLFEKDKTTENKYWVIDGQQRLTTVIIFFSCLIRELEKRERTSGKTTDENDEEVEIWRIRENYVKIGRNYKFSTVSYDNPFFENLIFENNQTGNICDSASTRRIEKAKEVFENLFRHPAETTDILRWKKIIDDAVITTFEVSDKVQATQIFAFQNDRGKDLTTLEKLKSFLMHKIYSVSEESNPEDLIKNIKIEFSDIYRQSERLPFDEDRVLNFHNTAFLSGENDPLDNVKSVLAKITDNGEKEKWIKDFVHTLKETFFNIEIIENKHETNNPIADVLLLATNEVMPLLIKLYHFHKNDEDNIMNMAKLIEKILFKLFYKTADYRTNGIPTVARHYNGDIAKLDAELNSYVKNGFQWWWDFNNNCKNYFERHNWHYTSSIKYVLWKYENYLREKKGKRLISPHDFVNKFDKKRLENTIDHITPQNPTFIEYTEEFKRDYLHNIGNLVLMIWGDNSEKRNNNPVDEVDLYDSDYYSHKEIRNILKDKGQWGENEIKQRKENIITFIKSNWGLCSCRF
jgi:uncharacterized protein with ParB-like and HNH nuclease domain